MPELPEIETIKRVIGPQIKGLTIQQITVNRPEVIAHPVSDEFCRRITGQIFAGIERRGKFLILCMKSGDRLILHLRMTGCLTVTPTDYPEEKHTHLMFHLSDGREACAAVGDHSRAVRRLRGWRKRRRDAALLRPQLCDGQRARCCKERGRGCLPLQ